MQEKLARKHILFKLLCNEYCVYHLNIELIELFPNKGKKVDGIPSVIAINNVVNKQDIPNTR